MSQIKSQIYHIHRICDYNLKNCSYKAVFKSIMAMLERSISAPHSINVMQPSDIHIHLEYSPKLPLHTDFGDGETYAEEAATCVINHGVLGKGKMKQAKIVSLLFTMATKM